MRGCGAVHVDPHTMATGSDIDSFMALIRQKKQSALQAQDAALAAMPPPQSEALTRLRNSVWGAEATAAPTDGDAEW